MRRAAAWLLLSVMVLSAVRTMIFPEKVSAQSAVLYTYSVEVEKGYLALRTAKDFNKKNEIGKLNPGDVVVVCPSKGDNDDYWYVYAPGLKKHGYVNRNYLRYKDVYDGSLLYAKVDTGYLALRKEKSYNKSNEIGRLNTGDTVILLDGSDPTYCMVYAPTLSLTGYVNRKYLSASNTPYQEPAVPIGMAVNSYGEWKWEDDRSDYLSIHMEVTNFSRTRSVSAFEIQVYAEDVWGKRIYGEKTVYTHTTIKNVKPGETVYSDYITIPNRSRIFKVYAAVTKARLSDGTICEHASIPQESYVNWEITK